MRAHNTCAAPPSAYRRLLASEQQSMAGAAAPPTLMQEQRMYQVYSGPTIHVCRLTFTGLDTQPCATMELWGARFTMPHLQLEMKSLLSETPPQGNITECFWGIISQAAGPTCAGVQQQTIRVRTTAAVVSGSCRPPSLNSCHRSIQYFLTACLAAASEAATQACSKPPSRFRFQPEPHSLSVSLSLTQSHPLTSCCRLM